jgi:hypothetical protein
MDLATEQLKTNLNPVGLSVIRTIAITKQYHIKDL